MNKGKHAVTLIERGPCHTWWAHLWGAERDTGIAEELVPAGARPGSDWIAEIDADAHILAIVAPLPVEQAARTRMRPRMVPVPAPRSTPTGPPLSVGDIVWARIEFTGNMPSRMDRCFSGKDRPAIVVRFDDEYVVVRPCFGTAGWNASHGALPLRDWAGAGLDKPTVVGTSVTISRAAIERRIGRLTERDRWVLDGFGE